MRIAAFPDEIIAPTMGHADTHQGSGAGQGASKWRMRAALYALSRLTGSRTPKHSRSTVSDTEGIRSPEDRSGSEWLLVPRGGIEPPTRGFSVPASSLGSPMMARPRGRQNARAKARSCQSRVESSPRHQRSDGRKRAAAGRETLRSARPGPMSGSTGRPT